MAERHVLVMVRVFFWIEGRHPSEAEAVDVKWNEWPECRDFYDNREWQRDEAIRLAVSQWLYGLIRDEVEDYPFASEPAAIVSARLDGSDHVRTYAIYADHHRGAEFDATEFANEWQEVMLAPEPPRLPNAPTRHERTPGENERRLIDQNKLLRAALREVLDEAMYVGGASGNADWRKLSERDVVQAARRLVDLDKGGGDRPEVVRGMETIRARAGLALDGGGVGGAESSAALDPLLVGVDP